MTSAQPLPEETLTITEVAARTGLSTDTLRYYEKAGLIDRVGRSTGGRRRYAAADLNWIAFLLRLRDTGMSIADMQRFAELRRGGDATMAAGWRCYANTVPSWPNASACSRPTAARWTRRSRTMRRHWENNDPRRTVRARPEGPAADRR